MVPYLEPWSRETMRHHATAGNKKAPRYRERGLLNWGTVQPHAIALHVVDHDL